MKFRVTLAQLRNLKLRSLLPSILKPIASPYYKFRKLVKNDKKNRIYRNSNFALIPYASYAQPDNYDVNRGNGNGIRFWSNDVYKIHMGSRPTKCTSIENMPAGLSGEHDGAPRMEFPLIDKNIIWLS